MSKIIKTLAMSILISSSVHAQPGQQKFIDPDNMNQNVKPGDDFYEYANGGWMKKNTIPAKETRWGSFNVLREFNINAVKSILEKAAKSNAALGSVQQRVGNFYAASMDSAAIEKLGYKPIVADLKRINALKNYEDIIDEISFERTNGIASPLYSFFVGQDRKNVENMMVQVGQGGTTLSDRDNYLNNDKRSQSIQVALKNYIQTLFELTGKSKSQAAQNATAIYNIEKELAALQLSRVEMRDAEKTYNKFSIKDFSKTTPALNWSKIFNQQKAYGQDSVLVNNPNFFAKLSDVLHKYPVTNWKAYLEWNILKSSAPFLSSAFVNADFAFNQVISGQKVQTPRWQRMSSLTDGSIGELLGQLYVKQYFKPEAKARMNELIENLRKAFEIRINGLEWMSAETKVKALKKLAAFRPKIGYPDKWENYNGINFNRKAFFANVRAINQWRNNYMVTRLGKPVDRDRFGMTPPTVNAYYSPTLNEIVFPAGILQFPFFDPNADDAINYGGIGAVIGHEMSHGFDDQGSKYDADGTLRNWWTEDDRRKFDARTSELVKQYDGYKVNDLHVNGRFTLGENIGDLGGLNAAYEAFKMTKQGQSNTKIDGFTPDQRFFLSWAQVWRGMALPETAAQLIKTDPHAPAHFRAVGAPVNMDAWYKAFDVKPGDKQYKTPEERIRIW
ncbi:MAG: M13 family peptidase [Chitinophagaceae bacterium]|nr:MAG: M13 family peptidase [Chitinophagaceae bacterium]